MSKTTKKSAIGKGVTPAVKKYVKTKIKDESKKKYEVKYHTTQIDTQNATDNLGQLQRLTSVPLPAAGAQPTDTTRIGDSIYNKALEIRGIIKCAGTTPTNCRLIVFQWHVDDNVTVPVSTDILSVSQSGGNPSALSPFQHDAIKANKFTVLYDRTFPGNVYGDSSISIYKKIDLKFAKKKIQFTGGTLNGMHHIYALWESSDSYSAGVKDQKYSFVSREFFIDP